VARVGGYGTVAILLLAGWTFLRADVAWIYLGVAVLFELWLALQLAKAGRHPAAAGEPPYHFSEEEAALVGRFRFYFTDAGKARGLSSVLAATGLTSLLLVFWLAYREAFAPAAAMVLNTGVAIFLTRRLVPMVDTRVAWEKIRAGNA